MSQQQNISRANRIAIPVKEWREDADGNLRVTARVMLEGVYSYHDVGQGFEYIPAEEFTEAALQTLEGRPVIVDEHSWRDAQNTTRDGLTKGSVAGTPYRNGGEIVCDFLIQDKDTAEAIKNGALPEVSASYLSDLHPEEGEFNGQQYTAVQRNLRFNHVLLCSPGTARLGSDTRIINQKQGNDAMSTHAIEMRIGNSVKTYRFSNQEDAEKAQEMTDEVRNEGAAEIDNAMKRMNEIKAEKAALEEETAKLTATLEDFKTKLEEATSMDVIEAAAEELNAQTEVISDLVETEDDKEKRDTLQAEVSNCKTLPERRAVVVKEAMRKNGIDASGWGQERLDGAFHVFAAQVRANKKKAQEKRPANGGEQAARNNTMMSAKDRMLAPYAGK